MRAQINVRRSAMILGGLAVMGAIAWYALQPDVIEVETSLAKRGPMTVTVDEDGRTRVHDRYIVAAPVSGRLQRLELREGDRVTRGQTIAWIAPLPLDSAARRVADARLQAAGALRREADSRVAQARVVLEQARITERRQAALLEAGAISPEQRENAAVDTRVRAGELAAAISRTRAATADVDAARAALFPATGDGQAVPVRSPVNGRVLRVPEPSERVIAASSPILELGDATALEVVADVLSSDAVRVRPGNSVEVIEWGGDHPIPGRVRAIEPSAFTRVSALGVDEQRVNILIDLIDQPPSLGDGFRVEIRATVWEGRDVLTIPSSALFQSDGTSAVFVMSDRRARLRRVQTGHRTGATVEIVGGLDPGERVILFPSDEVEDGSRVR